MTSITLHPEHGVNPSIEQKVCPISGKTWDSGAVLMLGRNKGTEAERYTTTGWEIDPEIQKILADDRIALVGCDESKSEFMKNGNINPEGAYRTGEIAYLKREAYDRIFDTTVPRDLPFVYVDSKIIKLLGELETTEGSDEKK